MVLKALEPHTSLPGPLLLRSYAVDDWIWNHSRSPSSFSSSFSDDLPCPHPPHPAHLPYLSVSLSSAGVDSKVGKGNRVKSHPSPVRRVAGWMDDEELGRAGEGGGMEGSNKCSQ